MIKIGIRAHDIGKMDAYSLAEKVKSYGFSGVQLVLKKALIEYSDLDIIKDAFKNLEIMLLGAYFNPVHPNEDIVNEGIKNFEEHIKIASKLNVKYVGSETGSLMGSLWGYVEENHSQESLARVIEIFYGLVNLAKEYNVKVAIEGAYAHVAFSPERVKEVIDAIDSDNLKVTVDLFNFLNMNNYSNHIEILNRCFDLFKDKIAVFHLKDFIVVNGKLIQVGLGKGLMDYPRIINRIKAKTPNTFLIFEGVINEDIIDSLEYINSLLEKR
jgi:sugar phosphate isomerase/epimerase